MKLLLRLGTVLAVVLVGIAFFFIGFSLAQSSTSLIQFITGVNKWEYAVKEQTTIYYSDNSEMGKIGYQKEYSDTFPEFMKQAVVAVEDRRFYEHNGLDSRGIGRAIWNNIKKGSKSEGGSTITQQLARTLFLDQQKTYSRKIKEIFIASAIEDKYSKEAILEMYLNEIYLGRGCSGMQSAAKSYFAKDVKDLNEVEITMLVGMIKAPEYYSPDNNLKAVKERNAIVVNLLTEQELISSGIGEEIKSADVYIHEFVPYSEEHPYYMSYLKAKLEEIVGAQKLYQGGLKIYTTINPNMQTIAEKLIKRSVTGFKSSGLNAKDAAMVSIAPRNGAIRVMVGGANYQDNQFNMAVSARQPGSAIKPLYYAAAVKAGKINEGTVLNNQERDFGDYIPKNFGTNNPGTTTARKALINSYNVASVEVLDRLGIKKAVSFLEKVGITSIEDNDKTLALALGGMERGISPLQLASAYTIFPAQGIYRSYYTIEKIEDEHGNIIYSSDHDETRVLKPESAQVMDSMLKDVVNYGTGNRAKIAIPCGGKTGTTTDSKDLWFVGYTSELLTAVWIGNSDGQKVHGGSSFGGSVAAPIWRDYMNQLIYSNMFEEVPFKPQPVPEPKKEETLDEEDGLQDEESDTIETENGEDTLPDENEAEREDEDGAITVPDPSIIDGDEPPSEVDNHPQVQPFDQLH